MQLSEIIKELEKLANPENVKGMARYGIVSKNVYGIGITDMVRIARGIGKDHNLALQLWDSGIYECRILACLTDDSKQITEEQMESWVKDFDSWAVCDECCNKLFDKSPLAYQKAVEWSRRKEEYVKRAGFVLMATLAVHDKKAGDVKFIPFLPLIKEAATDERNYVKKAVNWALRQIGKRNLALNKLAINAGEEIRKIDSRSAKWIAADALRELRSKAVLDRLNKSSAK